MYTATDFRRGAVQAGTSSRAMLLKVKCRGIYCARRSIAGYSITQGWAEAAHPRAGACTSSHENAIHESPCDTSPVAPASHRLPSSSTRIQAQGTAYRPRELHFCPGNCGQPHARPAVRRPPVGVGAPGPPARRGSAARPRVARPAVLAVSQPRPGRPGSTRLGVS
jgi:hypothetical protein